MQVLPHAVHTVLQQVIANCNHVILDYIGACVLMPIVAYAVQTVLQQLTANGCHSISTVSIQLPPPAPLRTLSLTGCRKLKEVVVSAPQLESQQLTAALSYTRCSCSAPAWCP